MAEQNINKDVVMMEPINGASKAKRKKWGDLPNDRSWILNPPGWVQNNLSYAFQRMFREGNDTLKVYDINPYVEVYKYTDNMYGLWNPGAGTGGDVWQYLIIGPEKAMLIDTAYGWGNQKGLVDEITGNMPLIVVNTHLGSDHSMGNVNFGTVYCQEYEVDNIKNATKPEAYTRPKSADMVEWDINDAPKYKDYELIGVPTGHIFNLGGNYDIEVFWTAGHAAGHAMYIDKVSRNLIAGDDVISDRIGIGGPKKGGFNNQYCNLTTYRDRMKILSTRIDEFDYVFSGHFVSNLESNVILNIVEAMDEVIADPKNNTTYLSKEGGNSIQMYKCVKGLGRVRYNENSIYPSEG